MTVANEQRLIALGALVLILAFVGGLLAAFATHDWQWVALPALAGFILVRSVQG